MTEKRCSKCKTTKPVADFTKNRAKPDGLADWCRPCRKAHYQEKNGGQPVAQVKRKSVAESETDTAAAAAPVTPLEISIAPGFGFDAVVEDDKVLRITQFNSDGASDDIVLSRTEAKVLFAQFHDWVHG